jgi:Domain of unknown function (DUF5666)
MNTVRLVRNGILMIAMLLLAGRAHALGLQDLALGASPLAGTFQQLQVEGKATISAVAGTCPAVVLTIAGIPVTVDATTTFPAGHSCGQLAVNQRVEVRGLLTIAGGVLSVVATTIEIEDGSEGEGEGRVTAIQGTCPNITLTVDGLTVNADALTKYVPANRGAGCDQIKVGTKIKVKAVPATGGGYRARLIEIKGHRHFGEGEGRITQVTGVCPDATIYFGTTAVQVNAATDFVGGSCADLAAGVRVQARGFKDDGATANLASWVRFKSRRVEGRSTVTAVSGTCPALAFTVGGVVRVVTDASTRFEHGTCASLTVGTKVRVKGDMKTDDGEVIAEEIEIEGRPGRSR